MNKYGNFINKMSYFIIILLSRKICEKKIICIIVN